MVCISHAGPDTVASTLIERIPALTLPTTGTALLCPSEEVPDQWANISLFGHREKTLPVQIHASPVQIDPEYARMSYVSTYVFRWISLMNSKKGGPPQKILLKDLQADVSGLGNGISPEVNLKPEAPLPPEPMPPLPVSTLAKINKTTALTTHLKPSIPSQTPAVDLPEIHITVIPTPTVTPRTLSQTPSTGTVQTQTIPATNTPTAAEPNFQQQNPALFSSLSGVFQQSTVQFSFVPFSWE